MRHESLYLNDIVELADHIAEFIVEVDFQAFQEYEMLHSAVVQKMGASGESAVGVSGNLTSRHPEVLWSQIVGFLNILIHACFGIDWDVVWRAATN
jgi:uncharacterized protein with HEPN domain